MLPSPFFCLVLWRAQIDLKLQHSGRIIFPTGNCKSEVNLDSTQLLNFSSSRFTTEWFNKEINGLYMSVYEGSIGVHYNLQDLAMSLVFPRFGNTLYISCSNKMKATVHKLILSRIPKWLMWNTSLMMLDVWIKVQPTLCSYEKYCFQLHACCCSLELRLILYQVEFKQVFCISSSLGIYIYIYCSFHVGNGVSIPTLFYKCV